MTDTLFFNKIRYLLDFVNAFDPMEQGERSSQWIIEAQ